MLHDHQVAKQHVEPMFTDLLQLMRHRAPHGQKLTKQEAVEIAKAKVDAFCQKWAEEASFVAYFQKQWVPKIRKFTCSLAPSCCI